VAAIDLLSWTPHCGDKKMKMPKEKAAKLPMLPLLLARKVYKTGQTRGADDDEIFQNRVGRNSTVLIPYDFWKQASVPPNGDASFENGFIALISPSDYFERLSESDELEKRGLKLGRNALVFYETRIAWNAFNPDALKWKPATSRIAPLKGKYVARIPGTTALDGGEKIIRGFNSTGSKGAGIRVYEYATSATIKDCRLQLEALFWLCLDGEGAVVANGMEEDKAKTRKAAVLKAAEDAGLLDRQQLLANRIINKAGRTTCPLCLEEVSATGFFNRMEQAEGRAVLDLTITQLNLFHIEELRVGRYSHKTYNMGWGHHHCNVVVKDSGIAKTLEWMESVIHRNKQG
jgi:hypothetical protein